MWETVQKWLFEETVNVEKLRVSVKMEKFLSYAVENSIFGNTFSQHSSQGALLRVFHFQAERKVKLPPAVALPTESCFSSSPNFLTEMS